MEEKQNKGKVIKKDNGVLDKHIKDKIDFTKYVLMVEMPFFGCLLHTIKFKAEDDGPESFWTNGKTIKFKKTYIKTISKQVFATHVLKILMHIVLKHRERGRDKMNYKVKYAIAATFAVNNILKNETFNNVNTRDYFDLDEKIFVITDGRQNFDKKSAEEIFNMLPDFPDSKPIPGNLVKALENSLDLLFDKEFLTDEDIEQLNNDILSAYNISNGMNKGTNPAFLERMIGEMRTPKIDWRTYLRNFLQKYPSDWDFGERDRRYMNSNIILPSLGGEKVKVAVGLDCSGSIGQDEINTFLSECFSIFNQFKNVEMYVMSFDAAIGNSEVVHTKQQLAEFKVIGGGGTDFRPCFTDLEQKNMLDGLIMFTDGYGDFPEQTRVKKTLWIMSSDVVAPFGASIKYQIN